MKTELEIKQAHDRLIALTSNGLPFLKLPPEHRALAAAQLNVLCWILEDESGSHFGDMLENMDSLAQASGYSLTNTTN